VSLVEVGSHLFRNIKRLASRAGGHRYFQSRISGLYRLVVRLLIYSFDLPVAVLLFSSYACCSTLLNTFPVGDFGIWQ
jgi:hypothetical protein